MLDDWDGFEKLLFADILVDKDTRTIRMNTCKNCEKLSYTNFCKECNCFMPAKTWLSSKMCILGKWAK